VNDAAVYFFLQYVGNINKWNNFIN